MQLRFRRRRPASPGLDELVADLCRDSLRALVAHDSTPADLTAAAARELGRRDRLQDAFRHRLHEAIDAELAG